MARVGVLGNLSLDVRGRDRRARPGGGPYHAARALRLLGGSSVVLAKCARRDRDTLLPPLAALGVPVAWRGGESTASFRIDYDGDRRTMDVLALGDVWTEDEAGGWIEDAVAGARWIHVAPLAQSDFPPETLARLAHRRRVSLDAQGLVRPARTGPLELQRPPNLDLLQHVTFLKLAEEEAAAVAGDATEAAVRALGVPEVAVTLGSRGALLVAGAAATHIPARPVARDPTGAGDAFCAAYVASRAEGRPPVASARRATAVVAAVLAAR